MAARSAWAASARSARARSGTGCRRRSPRSEQHRRRAAAGCSIRAPTVRPLGGREACRAIRVVRSHGRLSVHERRGRSCMCSSSGVGISWNDSAAACSRRTWRSICSSRTSIGTGELAGGTCAPVVDEELRRGSARSRRVGSRLGCGLRGVRGGKRTQLTARRRGSAPAPIRNISMSILLRGSAVHAGAGSCRNAGRFRRSPREMPADLPDLSVAPDVPSGRFGRVRRRTARCSGATIATRAAVRSTVDFAEHDGGLAVGITAAVVLACAGGRLPLFHASLRDARSRRSAHTPWPRAS